MSDYWQDYLDDSFEILRLLHQSDKSCIQLVMNKNDQQLYVLKILAQRSCYEEIRGIECPILPKIEFTKTKGDQTIVLEEFIHGKNLKHILSVKGFLDEKSARDILLQLCEGLKVLHDNKIIHRDIKPSNIMVTNDGNVKLIDFDIARIKKDDAKEDTGYLGTKDYAPPEQFGFGATDERSDIYALGITMKELLGKEYQGNLSKILEKCTKVDPQQRYQCVNEIIRALKGSFKFKKSFWIIVVGILTVGMIAFFWPRETLPPTVIDIPEISNESTVPQEDSAKSEREANEPRPEATTPLPQNAPAKAEKNATGEEEESESKDVLSLSYDGPGIVTYHHVGYDINLVKITDLELAPKIEQSYDCYFLPDGMHFTMTITNHTTENIIDPYLIISFRGVVLTESPLNSDWFLEDSGYNSSSYRYNLERAVAPGESMTVEFTLNRAMVVDDASISFSLGSESHSWRNKSALIYFENLY